MSSISLPVLANHHYWPTMAGLTSLLPNSAYCFAHQLPTWPTVLPNMGCKDGPGPRPASWKRLGTPSDGSVASTCLT